MEEQVNGTLGDWAAKCRIARAIDVATKTKCLAMFRQGTGYRKTARAFGLKAYTVKDWLRKFKSGDESWAFRDGRKFCKGIAATRLVEYRHDVEKQIPCNVADAEGDGLQQPSKESLCGGADKDARSTEHGFEASLYCFGRICEQILGGRNRKKKELDVAHTLVKEGHTVKEACRLAGLPRCEYYRSREPTQKAKSDAELVKLMCAIENDKHVSSTYGIERLTGEVNNRLQQLDPALASLIRRMGERVNHKRIHRLMKKHGIHSRIRRRRHPANYYREVREQFKANLAPNILKRDFTAEAPLRKLTTDVTYIPCSDRKFLYLSALLDVFNREIVAYSLGIYNSEELVLETP